MSFNPLLRLSEQRVTEKQPEIMSYVFLFQLTKTLSSKIIIKKKKKFDETALLLPHYIQFKQGRSFV